MSKRASHIRGEKPMQVWGRVNPPPELVGLEDWRVCSYEPCSTRPEARGLGGLISQLDMLWMFMCMNKSSIKPITYHRTHTHIYIYIYYIYIYIYR